MGTFDFAKTETLSICPKTRLRGDSAPIRCGRRQEECTYDRYQIIINQEIVWSDALGVHRIKLIFTQATDESECQEPEIQQDWKFLSPLHTPARRAAGTKDSWERKDRQ